MQEFEKNLVRAICMQHDADKINRGDELDLEIVKESQGRRVTNINISGKRPNGKSFLINAYQIERLPFLNEHLGKKLMCIVANKNSSTLMLYIGPDLDKQYLVRNQAMNKIQVIYKFNIESKIPQFIPNAINQLIMNGVLEINPLYSGKKYLLNGQAVDNSIKENSEEFTVSTEQLRNENNSLRRGNSMNSNEIMELGVQQKKKGNYNEAIRLYREALKLNSSNPDIYMSMGKTLYILGRFEEAGDCYLQCAKLGGRDNINVWSHLGHVFVDSNIKNSTHGALAEQYRVFLDPYFENHGTRKYNMKLSFDIQENYKNMCMNAGENFLEEFFSKF
jgi:tetratricopeptide (TPR) repeat protein